MTKLTVDDTLTAPEDFVLDMVPTSAGEWTPHRPERPEKAEGGLRFQCVSEYTPMGDQPTAIKELVEGLGDEERDQVLLGATGTGKTFTMAKIIEAVQRPALILAPNKTLAPSSMASSRASSRTMRSSISSPTTTITCRSYVPRTDTYIREGKLHQ